MAKKKCSACGVPKDAKDFYANRSQCRICYNAKIDARRGRKSYCPTIPTPPIPVSDGADFVAKWPNLVAFDDGDDVVPFPKVVQRVEIIEEVVSHVEEHRLKRKLRETAAQVKSLTEDLSNAQAMGDLFTEASRLGGLVNSIRPREHLSGLREATAVACASDWHIEEEVRAEQVAGRNRYNLEISERRMTRFFEATRWAINFNRQVFLIRDLVLWLGGDIITNYLHPDNVETNLLSPPEAIAYAHASIVTGIRYLLEDDQLERIVVPCNDGNHGRMTEKMRAAARTENSIEILLYTMLAREFKDEPRVQFIIAEGAQLYYDIYGKTVRFTHGDTAKYGGGVGGITVPIYKAMARWDTVRVADLTIMGHFHQLTSLRDLVINGSLIGYSAYALAIGARFEPPAQAFFMLDPVRFRSIDVPLWVSDREDDNQ